MIRAYDEHGNIARCAECKYYDREFSQCNNIRNRNRGSGDEYSFELDYVGGVLLTRDECDNWVCADFKLKKGDRND